MPKLPKIAEIEIQRDTHYVNSTKPMLQFWHSLAILALLAILAGCNSSQPGTQPSTAPQAATAPIDPVTAGSISGVVSFKGAPPKIKPLDMTADPGCRSQPQPADAVVVNGGRLTNVFVYVKEGLPQNLVFAHSAEPVVLDAKGCRSQPD